MRKIEKKTSTTAHNPIQTKRQPFFNKDGLGSFFSESAQVKTPFLTPAPIQPKFESDQHKEESQLGTEPVQGKFESTSKEASSQPGKKANKTGLPDDLKSSVENLSGYAMDDVKVHRNSNKPAQLNAHAYAQGTDIHLASGQEKHLPHEAWHVVQQKQGRVKPTLHMKGKMHVNDDKGLENEADVMGAKVLSHHKVNPLIQQKAMPFKNLQFKLSKIAPMDSGTVQRVLISQQMIPALPANIDTNNLGIAQGIVNNLWDAGKRTTLADIMRELIPVIDLDANSKTLNDYISAKLKLKPNSVPENKTASYAEKVAHYFKYRAPAAITVAQMAALRIWVTGDLVRGINWKQIGNHLRGSLAQDEYITIGALYYLKQDQQNQTNLEGGKTDLEREQMAGNLLDAAAQDLNGGLAVLPDHDGMSYRMTDAANSSVYGGVINVGDYIRDRAFWSTSALKISGSAGTWGQDGTDQDLKVYFIINGSTGKYVSKHAQQEEGQHEVLFNSAVPFLVTKIGNFQNKTFFVYLTEVVPAVGMVYKNPYHGGPW